ncbi:PAS domain-containing protein [Aureococcus anophagefferens]|nr:PAS domain-containing protein [Aureococcus anophagefferens]
MYGLGEKHASALRKLNKSAWLTDADRSMRVLLGREDARAAFKSFLASEYNEQALDFYLEAQKLVKLAPNQQASEAQRLLDTYMGAAPPKKGSRGIGQQDRTKATSTLWDGAKKGSVKSKTDAYVAVQKEAQNTFKMLVVRDADEWLSAFTQIAETWPACIVVSDMTIPGAPMVYVNPEFCRVTEYTSKEAVGRNCRFLQGPDTESESIGVIQRTLGKGEDCHVLLTNYRKSGEKFKNLLSMRPVFDADDVYRYVIGVQFEVVQDETLSMRLGQLDKLLRMLPKKLPVRGGTRKVEVEETRAVEMTEEHCVASMFATTKLKWLSKPAEAVRGLVSDPESAAALERFAAMPADAKPVFDAWDKYSYCVGAQVDLTDGSASVERLVSRLLRLSDVGRVLPEGMGGKRFRTDHTEEVVPSVRAVPVRPKGTREPASIGAVDGGTSTVKKSKKMKGVEVKRQQALPARCGSRTR